VWSQRSDFLRFHRKVKELLGKEKLDRINFLANKKKTIGLTEEETIEQKELREAYLASFRKSFKQQLEHTDIVYKD